MNRFQSSAQRIIDGNFGSLKKSLIIVQSDGYDYNSQESVPQTIIGIDALKLSLDKSEFENQDIQQGDFALIFTADIEIDVDRHSGIYDGVDVSFITSKRLAADAAQRVIARVK